MTTLTNPVSRRTALAGLGAGGLGVALAATTRQASAQDAAADMAGHPLVGTWIVDPEPDNPANVPSLVTYSSDGIVIDPVAGFAGSWEPTGPRTAVFTLSGIPGDGSGGYIAIRGPVEVEEATDMTNGPYTVTIVGADGTVQATVEGTGRATRLPAESGEPGMPLAGFPTWTPATPEAATPTT
jgi:hypothetical protein